MRKIDIEKSTIYTSDIASVSLCLKDCSIGQRGYFSNDFTDGDFINDYYLYTGTIEEVIVKKDCNSYFNGMSWFKCFIPEDKLVFVDEQPTKKYRPFMYLDELPFNVGDVVIYRAKHCASECEAIVTEIEYQSNDDCDLENIIIGGINVTPQELFDHYELLADDCQYKPFGVEE